MCPKLLNTYSNFFSDERLESLKHGREIDVHKVELSELCRRFNTSPNGLTNQAAKANFEEYGKNALSPPKTTPEWVKFCKQLFGGFSMLLWIGGILSFVAFATQLSQDPDNPVYDNAALGGVLIGVVIITGCFAYYQV